MGRPTRVAKLSSHFIPEGMQALLPYGLLCCIALFGTAHAWSSILLRLTQCHPPAFIVCTYIQCLIPKHPPFLKPKLERSIGVFAYIVLHRNLPCASLGAFIATAASHEGAAPPKNIEGNVHKNPRCGPMVRGVKSILFCACAAHRMT